MTAWRFLRSRHTGPALLAGLMVLVALRLVGAITVSAGLNRPVVLPLALLIPAALACIIGLAAESRMRPFDDLASGRLRWHRLMHLTVLLVPAAFGVLVATPEVVTEHGPWSALRNLAGLTGATLLTGTVGRSAWSWLPAVLLVGATVVISPAASGSALWSWLVAPQDHTQATAVALGLCTVGCGAMIFVGEGGAAQLGRRLRFWVCRARA